MKLINHLFQKARQFFLFINPFDIRNTKYIKLVVSIYPAVAAVTLAFFKDPIVDCTKRASAYIQHKQGTHSYTINGWVTLYWILLFFWLLFYYIFITNESATNKKNTDGLKSAIFRAPNPKVYGQYKIFYKAIMQEYNELMLSTTVKECEIKLRKILDNICLLTSTYISQKDTDEIYGASIMLYLPYKLNADLIRKIRAKGEFLHYKETELASFNGILYLVPELIYKSDESSITTKKIKRNVIDVRNRFISMVKRGRIFGMKIIIDNPTLAYGVPHSNAKKETTSISIPVYYKESELDNAKLNIPGAPRAATTPDGYFLFADVRSAEAYNHIGVPEVENGKHHWENVLPHIHSILSFAFPYEWNESTSDSNILETIGVLNIDSSKKHILGIEKEYHLTFFSLIYPLLCQLAPAVRKYYELTITDLELKY